jgi:hypothetical protein
MRAFLNDPAYPLNVTSSPFLRPTANSASRAWRITTHGFADPWVTGCLPAFPDVPAIAEALLVPTVCRRIGARGAQAVGSSAAEFERFVAQDVLRWRDVVRYAGAKPE